MRIKGSAYPKPSRFRYSVSILFTAIAANQKSCKWICFLGRRVLNKSRLSFGFFRLYGFKGIRLFGRVDTMLTSASRRDF